MLIYEPRSYLDVDTPLGRGNVWLIKDYGLEMDTYYTVVIREGPHAGQIFDFPNSDIRVASNYTLHRGRWEDLSNNITKKQASNASDEIGAAKSLNGAKAAKSP